MRIITETRLKKASEKYPDAESSIQAWKKVVKAQDWNSFVDVKNTCVFAPDDEDFEKTQEIIDKLLDKGELGEEEEDYLNILGMLIHEYEEQQDLVPDIYGIELLKVLVEELNLKQKDLVPIFKTESIVSDVLKGKRKLTVEHIQKLGDFFKVSPAVFFPVNPSERNFLELA